jgi:glycerophosphoryl diester phosphodiesterase
MAHRLIRAAARTLGCELSKTHRFRCSGAQTIVQPGRPPRVLGYRGDGFGGVPNTIPALESVLEAGAEGIVVDAEVTRDGVLVACEDRLLRASSSSFRGVGEATYAQLQALDSGVGFSPLHQRTPIPRLDQVLATFGRRCEVWLRPPLILDARRGDDIAGAIGELARDRDVTILSEDFALLENLHELGGRLRRIYQPLDPDFQLDRNHRVLRSVDGLAFPASQLSPDQSADARTHGKIVVALDCDTPNAAVRALRGGVDVAITERPAWLRDWLAYTRQRSAAGGVSRVAP